MIRVEYTRCPKTVDGIHVWSRAMSYSRYRCSACDIDRAGATSTSPPPPPTLQEHASTVDRLTAFKVGDLVSQPRMTPTNEYAAHWLRQEVQIEVTQVESNQLTAKVTALGDFFSTLRPGMSHGFVLGETLVLARGAQDDTWKIKTPRERPWHVLSCRDGEKTFEHYR